MRATTSNIFERLTWSLVIQYSQYGSVRDLSKHHPVQLTTYKNVESRGTMQMDSMRRETPLTYKQKDRPLRSFPIHNVPSSTQNARNDMACPKHCRSKSAPGNIFDLFTKEITPGFTEGSNLNKRLKIDRNLTSTMKGERSKPDASSIQGRHTAVSETEKLAEEINFLEEEIADLEQYVLTLYRSLFNKCMSRNSSSIPSPKHKSGVLEKQKEIKSIKQEHAPRQSVEPPKLIVPSQCHVQVASSARQSMSISKLASTVHAKTRHAPMLCESIEVARHCQVPIAQSPKLSKGSLDSRSVRSMLSMDEDKSSPRLLKDYLTESPNQLSEDLVQCMTNIYCKLSTLPPSRSPSHGTYESPLSSTSSLTSMSSAHGMFGDLWSPASQSEPSCDTPLADPFQVKGNLEWRGAYNNMIEIPHICTDKDRLNCVTRLLRSFRSLVEKLERVDPSRMKHDEKLAFWINIYNALLMHAYLAYGIPHNHLKRISLLQKACYRVGGHSINAHIIEHYILRCGFHRPTQWLQSLLSPSYKLKSGDGRRAFAVERAEPLVCFALCCGGRSDPAVRIYTAKRVHDQLETAMKEYLQASIGFQNSRKIYLPKILEWYMKEASLSHSYLLDWVAQYVNEQEKENIRRCIHSKPHRTATHCIEWMPYNFSFRYILHRDVTSRVTPSVR
ncbi:hypothetical protein KP509_12G063900 [Ceratopteris richardii]|uniref:DUF547 domain-containing protein n=3 Tax=Ceratopteris richardii TaxID=49495 RepID=A0A8T2TMH4_CERRI|nr:hypothetical protein KP509_12G063900 [Ceratopteris richardii]